MKRIEQGIETVEKRFTNDPLRILIILLFVLFVIFLSVILFPGPAWDKWLDMGGKGGTLRFIGIAMGGVLLAIQATVSYRRAKAMEDAAQAQAKVVEQTEQGQRQERFKNAIEHLGHKGSSVRLGGAYELFHLAEDTEELGQTVLEILCAHIRRTTRSKDYQDKYGEEPSEETQSLLNLLFVQDHKVFDGCRINLQGSRLNGVSLSEARLQKADLQDAQLQGADLRNTQMQGILSFDDVMALWDERLDGILSSGDNESCLGAQLQKMVSSIDDERQPYLSLDFAERIRHRIDQESDFSTVVFSGGLSEDEVNHMTMEIPDSESADDLKEKLKPHIGQPVSHELPADSSARTGTYTKGDAEQWIREYEEAFNRNNDVHS